jgi:hypothetical protein
MLKDAMEVDLRSAGKRIREILPVKDEYAHWLSHIELLL